MLGAKGSADSAVLDHGSVGGISEQLGFTGGQTSGSGGDTWKVQLGYQFNKNFAVEGGYFRLGEIRYNLTSNQDNLNLYAKTEGWNLDAAGILPVTDWFDMFAKLGVARSMAKVNAAASISGTSGSLNTNDDRWSPHYGFGFNFALIHPVMLRLEYERYYRLGTDNDRVTVGSVGLAFRF